MNLIADPSLLIEEKPVERPTRIYRPIDGWPFPISFKRELFDWSKLEADLKLYPYPEEYIVRTRAEWETMKIVEVILETDQKDASDEVFHQITIWGGDPTKLVTRKYFSKQKWIAEQNFESLTYFRQTLEYRSLGYYKFQRPGYPAPKLHPHQLKNELPKWLQDKPYLIAK